MASVKPSYKSYIEFNESLEYQRENIDINNKSDIITILKPNNDPKSKSLSDKLLIDVKFPSGYMFSIAGREQIQDIQEFDKLFTFSIKVCDSNKNELNPESRIFIHKEKEIDEYVTNVTRLESEFYKNVSITNFCKDDKKLSNSIRTIGELYKFGQGVEFKEGEHLRIYVIDPYIDISPENVEFNINIDKWNRV